ncbi:uncharacterized protein LOC132758768 [Ruditapes philippinarum]|uniref:uncharacterized protein LOC132758768 n=1 Tax=Ruditapes philippinarum TaxID=129788 RepID=UPI00295ACC4C|nr:uncharacterized protein LOC132758768 [Ruditapes philippinarum]
MAGYFSFKAIVFLTVLCYSTASEPDIEPVCSKFKYDKQMLEKMVRMEAKMNQWDKEKENFEENMLSIMEHRKQEMKREFVKQNQQIGQMLDDYKKIREELKDKTAQLEKFAGNFTKTPTIAFNAYLMPGRVYGDGETVVFSEILLNEGYGYDKSTGIFTAPLAGLYEFSVHVCNVDAKFMTVAIVYMDTEVAATTEYESNSSSCSSVLAPVKMAIGGRVYVKSTYHKNAMFSDSRHRRPSFTGVLLNI